MRVFVTEMSGLDNLLQFIGISVIFIFILVITYYTTKFVGGAKLGNIKNSNFKVLETYKITQNKYLQIVQVGSKYFVISISKDDIRFITELSESDIIKPDIHKTQKDNFSEIFKMILKKQHDKNAGDDQKLIQEENQKNDD